MESGDAHVILLFFPPAAAAEFRSVSLSLYLIFSCGLDFFNPFITFPPTLIVCLGFCFYPSHQTHPLVAAVPFFLHQKHLSRRLEYFLNSVGRFDFDFFGYF